MKILYSFHPQEIPAELLIASGETDTLRASLGRTLNYLTKISNGALVACAADLYDSTSISKINDGFPQRILECRDKSWVAPVIDRRYL